MPCKNPWNEDTLDIQTIKQRKVDNAEGGIHGWGTTFGCLTEKGLF
jgi:hypothetical protein